MTQQAAARHRGGRSRAQGALTSKSQMPHMPMNRNALRLSCLPAILAALAGCTASTSSTSESTAHAQPATLPSDAQWLARGEYMVKMGGCNDCHTPGYADAAGNLPTAQWLVGSKLGYHGPWGTTYASNLRLSVAEKDEAGWLAYTAALHARPIMPDFVLRSMQEDDRRAIYRFIRSLGPAGDKAPAYLPPGRTPPAPYFQLVLPATPEASASAASTTPD